MNVNQEILISENEAELLHQQLSDFFNKQYNHTNKSIQIDFYIEKQKCETYFREMKKQNWDYNDK